MKKYFLNVMLVVFGYSIVQKRGAVPVPKTPANPYDALIADMSAQVENHPGIVVKQFEVLPQNWHTHCNRTQRIELMKVLVRAKWLLEMNFPATESALQVCAIQSFDIPEMIKSLKPLADREVGCYQQYSFAHTTDNVTQLNAQA